MQFKDLLTVVVYAAVVTEAFKGSGEPHVEVDSVLPNIVLSHAGRANSNANAADTISFWRSRR
jgi:hypothetical protein